MVRDRGKWVFYVRPSASFPVRLPPGPSYRDKASRCGMTAHVVKLPADDVHLGSDGPEVIVRLLVADVACADDLPDLPRYLRAISRNSCMGGRT
jgi:hypothetical protein